ncbi:hypothetical protein [Nocardia higoensis]|uniref:hypothetical protein n=1 Tax=Nocardia higoensis TaxID=228599 RepID=UPI0002FBCA2B|nr:hypothetical protein [Nocardia higoensis]
MSLSGKTLTRAQREALDARDAVLDRALGEARAIPVPDVDIDEEGDFSCRRCGCEGYRQPGPTAARPFNCADTSCGHGFFSHRVQ